MLIYTGLKVDAVKMRAIIRSNQNIIATIGNECWPAKANMVENKDRYTVTLSHDSETNHSLFCFVLDGRPDAFFVLPHVDPDARDRHVVNGVPEYACDLLD